MHHVRLKAAFIAAITACAVLPQPLSPRSILLPGYSESGAAIAHAAAAGNIHEINSWPSIHGSVNFYDAIVGYPIHAAYRNGHYDALLALLSRGANPNLPDDEGRLLLARTAESRQIDLLKALLSAGANPLTTDASGKSSLEVIVTTLPPTEITIQLQSISSTSEQKIINRALAAAVRADSLAWAEVLLKAGANPNHYFGQGTGLTRWQHETGHDEKDHPLSGPVIHHAILTGNLAMTELLVAHGAVIGRTGEYEACHDNYMRTPLDNAAMAGNVKLIELLVAHGAETDPDHLYENLPSLHEAVAAGKSAAVRALLRAGANVNSVTRSYPFGGDTRNEYSGITPLHLAAKLGHADIASILIAAGADCGALTKQKETPLHYAARSGSDVIVRMLTARNRKSATKKNRAGMTPLLLALTHGHAAAAARLLTTTPPAKADHAEHFAAACHGGNPELVRIFFGKEYVNTPDRYGWLPLHYATLGNSESVVRLLLNANAGRSIAARTRAIVPPVLDITRYEDYDLTESLTQEPRCPLQLAAIAGADATIIRILAAGRNLSEIRTSKNETLLHLLQGGAPESVISFLVSTGIKPSQQDNKGRTAFVTALANHNFSVAQLLAKYGADAPTMLKTSFQFDPVITISDLIEHAPEELALIVLNAAPNAHRDEAIRLLPFIISTHPRLSAQLLKQLPDRPDTAYYTALLEALLNAGNINEARSMIQSIRPGIYPDLSEYAVQKENMSLLRVLMESAPGHYSPDASLLCLAISAGTIREASYLIQRGGDCFSLSGSRSALHHALFRGYQVIVLQMLEKRPIPTAGDEEGNSLFALACAGGLSDIARTMLRSSRQIAAANRNGETPLHLAAGSGRAPICSMLLAEGAPIAAVDRSGFTPLHHAAQNGHADIVAMLLRAGAPTDAAASGGVTPLILSAENGSTSTIQHLLTAGALVNNLSADGSGALSTAIRANHTDAVRILVSAGATLPEPDPETSADSERYPFFLLGTKYRSMLKTVIKSGLPINHRGYRGRTLLHELAECDSETAGLLLGAAEKLNIPDEEGHYPVYYVLSQTSPERLSWILDHHLEFPVCTGEDTELHHTDILSYAGYQNNTDILNLLKGRRHALLSDNTAVQRAFFTSTRHSDIAFFSELMKIAKPDCSRKHAQGNTLLHEALHNGNGSLARILIKLGTPINTTNSRGETPLSITARGTNTQDPELLKYLLANGADLKRSGALAIAIEYNNTEGIAILDLKKVDPNDPAPDGMTPLGKAVHNNRERIPWLIKRGADVNRKDADGKTPLHHACEESSTEAAEMLLKAGADTAMKDPDGVTPLIGMIRGGETAMVSLLLQHRADPQLSDTQGVTPLQYALQGMNFEICDLLFAAGAPLPDPGILETIDSNYYIKEYLQGKGVQFSDSE